MRWRMVDRIVEFQPWRRAVARKAVTLEAYALLEALGRENAFPEVFTLEACVETARHLVARSSDFALTARLDGVDAFAFHRPVTGGRMLEVAIEVTERTSEAVACASVVRDGDETVAAGAIHLRLFPLAQAFDPTLTRGAWEQLHGAA